MLFVGTAQSTVYIFYVAIIAKLLSLSYESYNSPRLRGTIYAQVDDGRSFVMPLPTLELALKPLWRRRRSSKGICHPDLTNGALNFTLGEKETRAKDLNMRKYC